MPVLVFIAPTQLNAEDIESNTMHGAQLNDWKAELRHQRTVATFTSPEELSRKLYQSLIDLQQQGIVPESIEVTSPHQRGVNFIPTYPTPYIAHPYILSQSGFVGRETELRQLDDWLQSADAMLIIDAIGGTGKSALGVALGQSTRIARTSATNGCDLVEFL